MPKVSDPDMRRIVEFCRDSGLFWFVNADATRIDFMDARNPRVVLASFNKDADPEDVLACLRLLTVFR